VEGVKKNRCSRRKTTNIHPEANIIKLYKILNVDNLTELNNEDDILI
jgi:hypothetical protein